MQQESGAEAGGEGQPNFVLWLERVWGGVGLSLLLTRQGLPVFPHRFTSSRSLMAIMNGQSSTATVTSMTCMKR